MGVKRKIPKRARKFVKYFLLAVRRSERAPPLGFNHFRSELGHSGASPSRCQRQGVGVVVVAPMRTIHQGLASSPPPTLQGLEPADELGVVKDLDPALDEQRFELEVRFRFLLGLLICDPVGLERLTHPLACVTVAHH